MLFLVLGRGKTGRVVADVAAEHGHSVRVVGEEENRNATALTAPFLAGFDAVIDFTTPEAAVSNMRACLANGARMVVGTTGWYQHLDDMRSLAARKNAGFLYGTNFSLGVQAVLRLARELAMALPHYHFTITETHHVQKKDAPSGTALSLQQALQSANPSLQVEITSKREGDVSGIHVIEARSNEEVIKIEHEAFSRRAFAEGAVRAAEWIVGKTGVWNFSEIADQLS
ncbi:4-hydroxy-tetrahydrodipicolinate reductase [Pseudacidobacterium ailaaui]|jgi:4-hydroxy-tetrahydrodipicolinate reductase|uniref:4-hydroxy-tetrahydrodipicolinate reductase n=1 Tax=Pseudacidobacterium ailaaui TaxID=1382359 RepID=UPI00047AF526|nr:dihydrodipicolinate reductase C-terminal domain-containing protein [Pseudacidobacterium ailaaui]MBX6358476.1 4-hydroxy-tetrahydrodipicolinate reductase [Pseudacidobacterium ailaaui]MDI3254248.1 dihydrodipicolinate reductase C-terminal domain-containing protein [Bacillota bacterium]